jgi:hypothetical protein
MKGPAQPDVAPAHTGEAHASRYFAGASSPLVVSHEFNRPLKYFRSTTHAEGDSPSQVKAATSFLIP